MMWKDTKWSYIGHCAQCHGERDLHIFINAEHKMLKEVCMACGGEKIVKPRKEHYYLWFTKPMIKGGGE